MEESTDIKKTKEQVSNEDFIQIWNASASTTEAAENMKLERASVVQRAARLRKILGEEFLKRHPRVNQGRTSLKDNVGEIERLRKIAQASLPKED